MNEKRDALDERDDRRDDSVVYVYSCGQSVRVTHAFEHRVFSSFVFSEGLHG